MTSYISIHKSKTRYFWVAWKENPAQQPDYSGYATSKDEAIASACAAIGVELAQVHQLKSREASRWRGILKCKRCGSTNLEVIAGKGKLKAGLKCSDCDRLSKWLNEPQLILFQELRRNAC